MRTLRHRTDEHNRREAKNNIKTGRGTKHKRLLNMENKLRVAGGVLGGGWAKWVMGIKEDTCWDEHWVLYVSDKSLGCTTEAKTIPYVMNINKKKISKKNAVGRMLPDIEGLIRKGSVQGHLGGSVQLQSRS